MFTFNLKITSTTKATLSLTKFTVSIQGASSQNIIFSTPLYMRESFFWTVDLQDFFFLPICTCRIFFFKISRSFSETFKYCFWKQFTKKDFLVKEKKNSNFLICRWILDSYWLWLFKAIVLFIPSVQTYFWRNMALGGWHVKKIARHNELVVQVLNGRGQPLNLSNANLQNLGG